MALDVNRGSETEMVLKSKLLLLISLVVLAGEMGSGKSNILQRYHKEIFTRISPTIGSEFLTKKILLPNQPG